MLFTHFYLIDSFFFCVFLYVPILMLSSGAAPLLSVWMMMGCVCVCVCVQRQQQRELSRHNTDSLAPRWFEPAGTRAAFTCSGVSLKYTVVFNQSLLVSPTQH